MASARPRLISPIDRGNLVRLELQIESGDRRIDVFDSRGSEDRSRHAGSGECPGERHLRGLDADLGLLVTGSSDYHGDNKTTPIGDCTTDPRQYEALVAAATGCAPFAD